MGVCASNVVEDTDPDPEVIAAARIEQARRSLHGASKHSLRSPSPAPAAAAAAGGAAPARAPVARAQVSSDDDDDDGVEDKGKDRDEVRDEERAEEVRPEVQVRSVTHTPRTPRSPLSAGSVQSPASPGSPRSPGSAVEERDESEVEEEQVEEEDEVEKLQPVAGPVRLPVIEGPPMLAQRPDLEGVPVRRESEDDDQQVAQEREEEQREKEELEKDDPLPHNDELDDEPQLSPPPDAIDEPEHIGEADDADQQPGGAVEPTPDYNPVPEYVDDLADEVSDSGSDTEVEFPDGPDPELTNMYDEGDDEPPAVEERIREQPAPAQLPPTPPPAQPPTPPPAQPPAPLVPAQVDFASSSDEEEPPHANLLVGPTSFDFGALPVGSARCVRRHLVLRNQGNVPAVLSEVSIASAGNSNSHSTFRVVKPTSEAPAPGVPVQLLGLYDPPFVVNPGRTERLIVEFYPLRAGSAQGTLRLVLESASPPTVVLVAMVGLGLPAERIGDLSIAQVAAWVESLAPRSASLASCAANFARAGIYGGTLRGVCDHDALADLVPTSYEDQTLLLKTLGELHVGNKSPVELGPLLSTSEETLLTDALANVVYPAWVISHMLLNEGPPVVDVVARGGANPDDIRHARMALKEARDAVNATGAPAFERLFQARSDMLRMLTDLDTLHKQCLREGEAWLGAVDFAFMVIDCADDDSYDDNGEPITELAQRLRRDHGVSLHDLGVQFADPSGNLPPAAQAIEATRILATNEVYIPSIIRSAAYLHELRDRARVEAGERHTRLLNACVRDNKQLAADMLGMPDAPVDTDHQVTEGDVDSLRFMLSMMFSLVRFYRGEVERQAERVRASLQRVRLDSDAIEGEVDVLGDLQDQAISLAIKTRKLHDLGRVVTHCNERIAELAEELRSPDLSRTSRDALNEQLASAKEQRRLAVISIDRIEVQILEADILEADWVNLRALDLANDKADGPKLKDAHKGGTKLKDMQGSARAAPAAPPRTLYATTSLDDDEGDAPPVPPPSQAPRAVGAPPPPVPAFPGSPTEPPVHQRQHSAPAVPAYIPSPSAVQSPLPNSPPPSMHPPRRTVSMDAPPVPAFAPVGAAPPPVPPPPSSSQGQGHSGAPAVVDFGD